jgi:predicted GNAT family acetyltransferase
VAILARRTVARVKNNPDRRRYEIEVDDEIAGFAQYRERPGLLALTHTEIDERFEGQGLGSELVSSVLDEARKRGLSVLPFCPFVNEYIQRHREYVDLVPEDKRGRFGL